MQQLRTEYPVFKYEKFSLDQNAEKLQITFSFRLGHHLFAPRVCVPVESAANLESLENFAFHLGLIESFSYWKLTCSPVFSIEAGSLTDDQASWWHRLLLRGLGEFFYRNQIDFSPADFVRLESSGPKFQQPSSKLIDSKRALLLIAGGKDSSLCLELLKDFKSQMIVPFALNPTRATRDSAQIAGWPRLLTASRTIDPKLLELNKRGFLNGHTPFSAYLAFLASLTASVNGYSRIIVCNEESASEGNLTLHGMPINHQYSKSFEFECAFRDYSQRYLDPALDYFSLLRPISDLQVSGLFAEYKAQLPSFRSCNVGQKQDLWCGSCPKCAFVYLSLFPFIGTEGARQVFGKDLFLEPQIIEHIYGLVGLRSVKPFECVGSVAESQQALALSCQRLQQEKRTIPEALTQIQSVLGPQTGASKLTYWSEQHRVPEEYVILLQRALDQRAWRTHV